MKMYAYQSQTLEIFNFLRHKHGICKLKFPKPSRIPEARSCDKRRRKRLNKLLAEWTISWKEGCDQTHKRKAKK